MHDVSFATVLNCMDGRTQGKILDYVKEKAGTDFVDDITEPGMDGILFEGKEKHVLDQIKKRLRISANNHGSRFIALVGHSDCAGNPQPDEDHKVHIRKGLEVLRSWLVETPETVLIGLFIRVEGKECRIEEVI